MRTADRIHLVRSGFSTSKVILGFVIADIDKTSPRCQRLLNNMFYREKGSDASWTDNNEPPETYLEYSDDESEARHKRPKVVCYFCTIENVRMWGQIF